MRNHGDGERARRAREDREADPVDGDRALLDEVAAERRGKSEAEERAVAFGRDRAHLADAVDVPEDEMPAQAIGETERALEVDARPRPQGPERRSPQALRRDVDG